MVKIVTVEDIKKYLIKTNKKYRKKGFADYSDVEYFADNEPIESYVNKEIKRCQFLLDTLVELEKMLGIHKGEIKSQKKKNLR